MSLESKFESFKTKYDLEDEAIAEILVIFNEAFVELAHKLLASNDIQVPKTVKEMSKTYTGPKKWATKIAAEYAAENEVTLDDFDKEKVTKKDIDDFVKSKNNTKMQVLNTKPKKPVASSSNEVKNTTEIKEKCKGLTKTGEPCNRPGTEKPNGSKNCFCFRHAMDWKNYEVSSDSELDEEDIFTDPNKITIPDLAIRDPDEE